MCGRKEGNGFGKRNLEVESFDRIIDFDK